MCWRVDAIFRRNHHQRWTGHLCCPLSGVIIHRFANGQKRNFDIHLREADAVLLKERFRLGIGKHAGDRHHHLFAGRLLFLRHLIQRVDKSALFAFIHMAGDDRFTIGKGQLADHAFYTRILRGSSEYMAAAK
ncbi:hypothetical protein EDP2_3893 [Enterobacter cloacae S611]|uniref:Uncharacterized protein n=1 Tax=Enterobacter cloacae S611 TaxID=1399146 RepID=A0ABN0QDM5_ENTCL|nr:hypothetical protein EDP2_3893 [Enterobacter cloacae S611]